MGWLIAAYAIVWGAVTIYLAQVSRAQKNLARQHQDLTRKSSGD